MMMNFNATALFNIGDILTFFIKQRWHRNGQNMYLLSAVLHPIPPISRMTDSEVTQHCVLCRCRYSVGKQ